MATATTTASIRSQIVEAIKARNEKGLYEILWNLLLDNKLEFVSGWFNEVILADGTIGQVDTRKAERHYLNYLLLVKISDQVAIDPGMLYRTNCGQILDMQLGHCARNGVQWDTSPQVIIGTIGAARVLGVYPINQENGKKAEANALMSAAYRNDFILADVMGISKAVFEGTPKERSQIWNKVVDRLRELGVPDCDIRDHFLDCLGFHPDERNMETVMKLAGAKCFTRENGKDPRLVKVLREKYLAGFWNDLCDHPEKHRDDLPVFSRLCALGMVVDSGSYAGQAQGDQKKLVEEKLVGLMSRGKLGQVYEIVDKIGESGILGIIATSHHCDIATMSVQEAHDDCVQSFMRNKASEAFARAMERQDLGAAAALVTVFGVEGCMPVNKRWTEGNLKQLSENGEIDEVKEYYDLVEKIQSVVDRARKAGKRIVIDFRNYYY